MTEAFDGADVNTNEVLLVEQLVTGLCVIPLTVTTTVLADAGGKDNVNEVVVPSPVNELTVGFRSELDNCHG